MHRPDRLQIPLASKEGQNTFRTIPWLVIGVRVHYVCECITSHCHSFKYNILNMHAARIKGLRDNLFKLIFDIFASSSR